jgi:hypothetical protein
MSIKYLDYTGLSNFWTNIKNYITAHIPTKTSEIQNDSGYITNTDTCLHKSGGETFTGYKTVENINSGLIFKSTNYQAEIRLSGDEPYDVSIVSKNLSNNTYSYHTLMDRYGKVFPHIYRLQDSNLTVYVSNAVSNNDGDGLTANTAFSYSALRNFLGAIRMRSGNSIGGAYTLTINLVPTGISYGICRFDSTKMPYVKNLIIQTSTGIEGTPENYTTNCPDLLQLYISGNMDVTVRNIKCGEIAVYQGAKVTLTNFNAVGQVRADNNGYVTVGGYLYVFYFPLSTSPRVSLFDASLDGHIRIESSNTTINFSEQIYYTAGVLRAMNHGYLYANISRWKLLGIKPCVIVGSSTTVLTTCSTPGNVSAKTVETGTTIGTSSVIGVTFSETNTANNPTLNVNGLGDWSIVADNNAVDIKHYLPFGVRIIFKRFGNTWKITNNKDILQYIAGDCSMYVSGNLGTTYNNGEFNFGDYIVAQSTSSTNTGIYNATQYNINGTNIFDAVRTINKAWVFKESPQVHLRTEIGGTTYGSATVSFRDVNGKNLGESFAGTYGNGGSGVGLAVYNIIDNTNVYKKVTLSLSQNGDSHFYPGNPDDTYLGSGYYPWKGVYANKYYLGSTEFGDIVTHNASEFITEHQSLADYATKQDLADLVNSAPSTLDTLNELASALGNDPNFATTVSTQIGTKANDNAVVHLSGNETITGTKTLTDVVKIKASQIVAGTTYQSNKGSNLLFTDNNGAELGKIWNLYEASDSSTKIRISSSNKFSNSSLNPNGTLTSAYFDVGVKANGTRYLASNSTFSFSLIPTATYSFSLGSSSNKWKELWVANAFANRIDFQDPNIEKGVIPESGIDHSIRLTDKNNAVINYITFQKRADSNEPSRICIRINNENEDSYKSVNFNGSAFYPENNNAIKLGTSSKLWSEVHTTSLYLNGTQLDPSVFALDNSVVHTSGNETISGSKTFNDLQIIGYGTQYKGSRNAYILPEFSAGYSGLSITTLSFAQTVKIGNFVLDANNKPSLDTSKAYIQIATGESNNVNACVLEPRNSTSSSLGTSVNKWSKIYGTEYYYGANNVEFSDKFVTTDTEQIITGTKTFNSIRGIDLSDKTIDLNDCYSSETGGVIRYYCNTNSGTNNISNIPTNSSFSMISETYRYLSASDYLVKQTHIANHKTRTRYCSNGTWTDWKEIVDTDVNVTNTLATTTKAYITGTTSSSTNTGTQIFDTGVYLSTTAGELVASKFTGALNGTANRATADANGNNISSTYAKVSDMTEMTAEEVIAIANQILV